MARGLQLPQPARMQFVVIPREVLEDRRLDAVTLCVLIALRSFAWTHEGGCIARIKNVATIARSSESAVKRAIKRLAEYGYIERIEERFDGARRESNRVILSARFYGEGGFTQNPGGSTQNPPPVHTEPRVGSHRPSINKQSEIDHGKGITRARARTSPRPQQQYDPHEWPTGDDGDARRYPDFEDAA